MRSLRSLGYFAVIYDVASQSLLTIFCGSVSEPPGHPCAIEGAKRAYNNITS